MRVNDFIKNKICNSGPATIHENGKTILVGVASYVTWKKRSNKRVGEDPCGPGTNDGQGIDLDGSSDYVDIYSYVDWIKKTMGDYHVILFLYSNKWSEYFIHFTLHGTIKTFLIR